jgi:hypothetical protein
MPAGPSHEPHCRRRHRCWLPISDCLPRRYAPTSFVNKMMTPKPLPRRREHRLSPVALAVTAVLAITPVVEAVRIPFQNCLGQSYRLHEPYNLQWVPLFADASFTSEDNKHNLLVTVWGNVTGRQDTTQEVPGPDSPYWQDPEEINGKIIRIPDPNRLPRPLATTLFRKVNVLSYQPYKDLVDFCAQGLIDGLPNGQANGSCPLGPEYRTNLYVF